MFSRIVSLFSKKSVNIYHERKTKKSSDPVAAFFQQPAKEQKKAWKKIIANANKMQRDLMNS